jgi:hypothetical protein
MSRRRVRSPSYRARRLERKVSRNLRRSLKRTPQ